MVTDKFLSLTRRWKLQSTLVSLKQKKSKDYKEVTGQLPQIQPVWDDLKPSEKRYYQHHATFIKDHAREIVQKAEANEVILQQAGALQGTVKRAENILGGSHDLKKCLYGYSNLEFRFIHEGFVVGTCSMNMAVFGWTVSEYNKSGGFKHTVKWSGGLGLAPKSKVDPTFIGARVVVIVRDISREIK